jgi:hypothetical protein
MDNVSKKMGTFQGVNYQAITLKNTGEILGLIYSLQGGQRKKV